MSSLFFPLEGALPQVRSISAENNKESRCPRAPYLKQYKSLHVPVFHPPVASKIGSN